MAYDLTKDDVLAIQGGKLTTKEAAERWGMSRVLFNNIKQGKIKKYEKLAHAEAEGESTDTPKHQVLIDLLQSAKLRHHVNSDGRIFTYISGELLKSAGYKFDDAELRVGYVNRCEFIKILCEELDKLEKA